MVGDPVLGAATPADTADDTSRGHTQNNASVSGPGDDVAGNGVAAAIDITADESDITADSASPCDGTTATTASVVAAMAASSSPDVTVGAVDGATAAAPPTVRRRDDDVTVDPALGATALADASRPSLGMLGGRELHVTYVTERNARVTHSVSPAAACFAPRAAAAASQRAGS